MGKIEVRAGASAASETEVSVSASSQTGLSRGIQARRAGSQAYYWTLDWQQRERLADIDFAIGNVHHPEDVDELIRWLHED